MKRFAPLLMILAVWHCVWAQQNPEPYKFDEASYPGGGCREYGRVMDFANKIMEQEGAKGLIVMYAGNGEERFGNILGYVSGVKQYLVDRHKFPADRLSVMIAEGKTALAEEFWIVPRGAAQPEVKAFNFDWSGLKAKYYYSSDCFSCEPGFPELTSFQGAFEDFAQILKQYPGYRGLITVNDYAELAEVRTRLTKNSKLSRKRYAIRFKKTNANAPDPSINLYIVPTAIEK